LLYIRLSIDKPNAKAIRDGARMEHRAYARASREPGSPCSVVQAGPLCISDSDDFNIASFMILEADSLEAAQAFHDGDPCTKAGLYETTYIHRWDRHMS
jgi:uncharacterized protein